VFLLVFGLTVFSSFQTSAGLREKCEPRLGAGKISQIPAAAGAGRF